MNRHEFDGPFRMIKRLLIILTLLLTAAIFARLVLNYSEHQGLTKLAERYAGQGPAELGAPNLVTAVVVTYRGLDTLGEVTVLFISAAGVGLMLRRRQQTAVDAEEKKPSSEIVVTAAQLLLPIIFLFGVYVFVNGHLSPGGGFQGGAIIAAGSLLLLLAMPQAEMRNRLISVTESLSGFGYVLVGLLGVILAGGFLDNRIMSLGTYGTLFSAGAIPIIYTLVGLKVGSELSAVLGRFRQSD
jgi:multicomponent Na+:H+ antiporter subunit B